MDAAAIDAVLIPHPSGLVAEYYDDNGPFAGTSFGNVIGTNDLLALTLLDVAVPARGLRGVLGAEAAALSAGLSRVPSNVPLWEADDEVLNRCGKCGLVSRRSAASRQ